MGGCVAAVSSGWRRELPGATSVRSCFVAAVARNAAVAMTPSALTALC